MRKLKRTILIIVLLLIAGSIVVGIKLMSRTHGAYSIVNETSINDTNIKGYYHIDDKVLCYTSSAVFLTDVSGNKTWSASCNVSNPGIFKCLETYAIADINGNSVITFDKNGKVGSYSVGGVILKAAVADTGVTALVVKVDGNTEIHMYDKNGELLVKSTIGGSLKKYPVAIALSPDGTKLMVSYLNVDDANTSLFEIYDFSKNQKDATDSVIYKKEYDSTLISDIVFLDKENYTLVSPKKIIFYNGLEDPAVLKKLTLKKEIKSVFAVSNRLGVILNEENNNVKSTLHIYNYKGKEKATADIDISYTRIAVSDGTIALYNDYNGAIYSSNATLVYKGQFDDGILYIQAATGLHKYIFITNDKIQEVKLT